MDRQIGSDTTKTDRQIDSDKILNRDRIQSDTHRRGRVDVMMNTDSVNTFHETGRLVNCTHSYYKTARVTDRQTDLSLIHI